MFAVFPFHHETSVELNATLDAVFAYFDDFKKLSSHMEKSSGMMLGSSMTIETDDQHGRAVGKSILTEM